MTTKTLSSIRLARSVLEDAHDAAIAEARPRPDLLADIRAALDATMRAQRTAVEYDQLQTRLRRQMAAR